MSNMMDNSSNFCCFGPFRTHVVKGARKIAYFEFIICWIFALIFFFSQRNSILGVITLIEALTCLLIMISFGRRKHLFYLPFLFLYAIWIVLVVLITIYQIGTKYKWIRKSHFVERKLALIGYSTPDSVGMGMYVLGSVLGVLFFLWICSVAFRAFIFLRRHGKGAILDIVALPKHSDTYYKNNGLKSATDALKPRSPMVSRISGLSPQNATAGILAMNAMAGPQNNADASLNTAQCDAGSGITTTTDTSTSITNVGGDGAGLSAGL